MTTFISNLLSSSNRVRTPLLIQMEVVECGAVCLGIILGYYGKYVPIEELRKTCGVTRNGSSAYGVITAAEYYGMEAEGYSIQISELDTYPKPSILFWEYKHFVVYEGRDAEFVYINDPAVGPRKVDHEEFAKCFTGVILAMTPTQNFQKGGSPPSFVNSLKTRLQNVHPVLFYLMIVQIFIVIIKLIFPAMTKAFIDQIVVRYNMEWNWWFIGSMLALTIAMIICSQLQQIILYRTNIKMAIQSNTDFIQRLFMLPLYFFEQRYSGEVAYRSVLNEKICDTLTGPFFKVATDVFLAVIFGIAMFFYDPVIAITTIIAAVSIIFLLMYYQQDRKALYAGYQQHLAKNIGYSIGAIEAIESLKACGLESRVFSRWTSLYTLAQNNLQSIMRQDAFSAAAARFLQLAAYSILLSLGAWHVISGQLTAGGLIALQILLFNFLSPVTRLIEFNQELQLFKVDLDRVDDVMKYPIDVWYAEPKNLSNLDVHGKIGMKNVSFGYILNEPPIVNDISFTVEPGKSLAIVGPTGSGKSTLGSILSGLLVPWQGAIIVDDKNITSISKSVLTKQLYFLEQMNFLFRDTLRNNITLMNQNIPEKDILQALQDACLDSCLSKTSHDLYTFVEEMGANLSGGEKQRLQIARALSRNPKILILDEAMSALDADTEEKIIANILKRKCTLIIITHRLSVLDLCDEVIILEQGSIIQKGPISQLKAIPGLYKKLLNYEQA